MQSTQTLSHIFEVSNLKVGSKLQFMLMCVMSTTTTLHTVKDGSHAQRVVDVGSFQAKFGSGWEEGKY